MNDVPASKDSWQQNDQLTKNKSGRFSFMFLRFLLDTGLLPGEPLRAE